MADKELVAIVHDLIELLHTQAVEIDNVITEVEQVTAHIPDLTRLSVVRAGLAELQYRTRKLLEEGMTEARRGA